MSLQTQLASLMTRIGTEFKTVRQTIAGNNTGSLAGLATTAKGNLVAAINEVQAASAGASGISDGTTGTSTTWSSSKINTSINTATAALVASAPGALDTLDELAAALGDDANFATTTATALGNRVRADAAQSFTSPQQAQARTNIGAASAADLSTLSTNVGNTEADLVALFVAALA